MIIVLQNQNTGEIRRYKSQREAASGLFLSVSTIKSLTNGTHKRTNSGWELLEKWKKTTGKTRSQ